MTGKERIQKALKGEMPDETPVMLHNFMMAAKENGYTMEDYRKSPKVIADVFEQTVLTYPVDGVLIDIDTALLADCVGVPVDFPVDEPARTKGCLLKSLQDVQTLKPVDFSTTRVTVLLEALERLSQRIGKDFYIRGNCDQAAFSLAGMMRGTEDFLVDILTEEEDEVKPVLEYAAKTVCDLISLMKKTGVDMVSNGDSPAGPDMVSPEIYRMFAFPYEKQIADHAHSLGLSYLLHICGDTTKILEDMVQTGADCLELDYKTDLETIRSILSDTAFCGNIDPVNVLCYGSKELVRSKTEQLMTIQRDNPRFILNAGCALPPATPSENIREMIHTARQCRK